MPCIPSSLQGQMVEHGGELVKLTEVHLQDDL